MQTPYLIQRAKFKNRPEKTGIDSLLSFDYMGSTEFEWGALPKSLKRIREDISEYTMFQYSFINHPTKLVTVFCKKSDASEMGDVLEKLAAREYRLKEFCDLYKYVKGETQYVNDFWWDIDNDFFFWKYNPDFDLKFKSKIVPDSIEAVVPVKDNQTPSEYVKEKLQTMTNGNLRIYCSNLLRNSYIQSDKDFYTAALSEIDNQKKY